MDIDILLHLQQFRNGFGGIFAEFLTKMTFLGELNTVLLIMAVVYWCASKRLGTYLLMGWNANRLVNGFLKVTVCAYRPWIRDARIVPFGNSVKTATGYSFPSGHSTNASAICSGGMLWKSSTPALRILLGIVFVLVPFSRLYLGVHTPQDVLCGAGLGLLLMWLTLKMMEHLERRPEKAPLVAAAGIALAVLLTVYAACKSYPRDLDANGKVLVDGAKMAKDTFKAAGWCVSFLLGWLLERRFVGFSTDVSPGVKATRFVGGVLGFYAVTLILMPLIKGGLAGPAGTFASCFLQMLYIAFLFPLVFARLEKRCIPAEAARE